MKYTQILEMCSAAGRPAVTIELMPPRVRKSFDGFYKAVDAAAPLADMLSLTESPGAKFDMNNLIPAYVTKQKGPEIMFHITCRDATQRQAMGGVAAAYRHGIENVLILRGDEPGQAPRYKHSWQMIEEIAKMNGGLFPDGKRGTPLDMCIGCAVNPIVKNLEVEILHGNRLAGKAKAGAHFAVTQMFFEPQQYLDCLSIMRRGGINMPLIAGILIIENEGMIKYLEEDLSGIRVPDNIKAEFRGKSNEAAAALGLERAKSAVAELRNVLPGVHIYNGASPAALELARYVGQARKSN